jgi:hypothetical protein
MISMSFRRLAMLAAASTLLFSQFAAAQGTTGGPSKAETTPPGSNRPPEQAAIDACVGKAEGDRVVFTDAKGKKRKWTCVTVNGVLAARSGVATPALPKKKA